MMLDQVRAQYDYRGSILAAMDGAVRVGRGATLRLASRHPLALS
jgi:hypothetical protein